MKNAWRLKCLTIVLLACASLTLPAFAQSATPNSDPWEPFNRKVFGFNEVLDSTLIQPVARVYRDNAPDLVRTGVSNFFGNLRDLWSAINSALQAKPGPTLDNAGRFVINTTIGLYGLFDVATQMGMERHTEDFGQTLGRWGVPTGPYVVLPLFGPSTVRDGIGLIPDSRANLLNQVDDVSERNVLWASNLVDRRAQLLPLTDQADRIALDKYTFTRDTYLQKRRNDVYDGDPPETADPTENDSGADSSKPNP